MLLTLLLRYSYGTPPDHNSVASRVIGMIVILTIIGCTIYLFIRDRGGRWEDGIIPKSFKLTKDNLFEIYIAAGCAIIARDPERNYVKFGMVNTYLRTNFPNEYYDFADSYRSSLIYQIKINSLTGWCNKYLDSKQKARLLNFVVGLAVNDGYFTQDEKNYIHVLTQKLQLTFDHVEERFKKHFYAEEKKTVTKTYSSKQHFFIVLGLPETASLEDIKTTYRKLAKLTHPDRFMNEPPEIQEKMKRKFQEIQEAYEQISGN